MTTLRDAWADLMPGLLRVFTELSPSSSQLDLQLILEKRVRPLVEEYVRASTGLAPTETTKKEQRPTP